MGWCDPLPKSLCWPSLKPNGQMKQRKKIAQWPKWNASGKMKMPCAEAKLSDKATASVIEFMDKRYGLAMTAEQVQAICDRQKITKVINENSGIDDTYPREYWLDAIAVEWAGRDHWPINNDGPDPDFSTQLIKGYLRMTKGTK
jgi:hypothetical protein